MAVLSLKKDQVRVYVEIVADNTAYSFTFFSRVMQANPNAAHFTLAKLSVPDLLKPLAPQAKFVSILMLQAHIRRQLCSSTCRL